MYFFFPKDLSLGDLFYIKREHKKEPIRFMYDNKDEFFVVLSKEYLNTNNNFYYRCMSLNTGRYYSYSINVRYSFDHVEFFKHE